MCPLVSGPWSELDTVLRLLSGSSYFHGSTPRKGPTTLWLAMTLSPTPITSDRPTHTKTQKIREVRTSIFKVIKFLPALIFFLF